MALRIRKKTDDGFFAWIKAEYTLDHDPAIKSIEYYIEFKCTDKSSSDQIIKINWRKDEPEISTRKIPFEPVSKKHVSFPLFKEFCK